MHYSEHLTHKSKFALRITSVEKYICFLNLFKINMQYVKELVSNEICKIKLKEKFTICTSLNATTDVCARHSHD